MTTVANTCEHALISCSTFTKTQLIKKKKTTNKQSQQQRMKIKLQTEPKKNVYFYGRTQTLNFPSKFDSYVSSEALKIFAKFT